MALLSAEIYIFLHNVYLFESPLQWKIGSDGTIVVKGVICIQNHYRNKQRYDTIEDFLID